MNRVQKLRSVKAYVLLLICVVTLLGILPGGVVFSQDAPRGDVQTLAAGLAQGGSRISYHSQTGKVRFIGAPQGRSIIQSAGIQASASPEFAARAFLSDYGRLFGLKDQNAELNVETTKPSPDGRSSVRFQQVYNGIPV